MDHEGYNVLISGVSAHLPYPGLKTHFVKFFGRAPHQSNSARSCYLNAICNAVMLLLGEEKASLVCSYLQSSIAEASR